MQESQGAGGRLVHEPRQSPGPRSDDLSGEYVGLKRPFEHRVKRFGFCLAADEERDLPGVIEKNRGEGNPGRLKRLDPGGGNEPARFMHGLGVREQGGGMTIRSHPQQDKIEPGNFRFRDSECPAQQGFIPDGSGLGLREFARHAMNLLL